MLSIMQKQQTKQNQSTCASHTKHITPVQRRTICLEVPSSQEVLPGRSSVHMFRSAPISNFKHTQYNIIWNVPNVVNDFEVAVHDPRRPEMHMVHAVPCTCSCKNLKSQQPGRASADSLLHYFASADLDRFVLVLGLGRLGESAERDLRRTKTTKTTTTAAVDRSWRRCKQQSLGRKFRAFLTRNSPHNMCRGWLCKHIKAIWYTKHLEFLIGSISS